MKKNIFIPALLFLFSLSCATDSFGVYHTVKKDENIKKISELYQIEESVIRSENSLAEDTDELPEGTSIFIPGAEKVLGGEEQPAPAENTAEPQKQEEAKPEEPAEQKAEPEMIAQPVPAPEEAAEANESKVSFIWPSQGKITLGFSAADPKSDGIEIKLAGTQEIHAAAAGKVLFSAQHDKFGNMVILQHDDNFISIYANLGTLSVEEGQNVNQNDILGTAEKIHFEIREASKPVDPIKHLPADK